MILFINALKSLRSNKLKIALITFLVFLSTTIYTAFNTSIDSISKSYYKYLEEQNVFDIAFEVVIDYDKDFSNEYLKNYFKNKNLSLYEEELLNSFLSCKISNTCSNYLIYEIGNIFDKYGLVLKKEQEKLTNIKNKYDLTYDAFETKTITSNNKTIKVIPYREYKINIPYLVSGEFPKKQNNITILKEFAKSNDLEIKDNYTIDNKNFIITGFAYASNYIYPSFSNSNPIFDYKRNNIVFVNSETFKQIKGISNKVYVAKFNSIEKDIFDLEKDNITKTSNTMLLETSKDTLKEDLVVLKVFSNTFLCLILFITVILLFIILKKKIDIERFQIGVLKSLGYKNFIISLSFLTYPFITSLIGGVTGFICGNFLSEIIKYLYLKSFNLVVYNSLFNISDLFYCIFIPMFFLSLLSFIFTMFLLRKKEVDLIKTNINYKVNILSKLFSKIIIKKDFLTKLKYSLLTKSIGRLIIVLITSFTTGFLITLIFSWFNIFNRVIEEGFSKYKFNYMITYNNLIYKENDSLTENILKVNADTYKILNKNKKTKEEKNINLVLNGVANDLKFTSVVNKNGKHILNYLADKTIIINENIRNTYNIDIGDYLVFKINKKEVSFEVIAVENNYLDNNCYVKIEDLSSILGFNNLVYNVSYSKDPSYGNLMINDSDLGNINEIYQVQLLKENLINSLKFYNNFTYIIVIFCGILVFVIIAIIANVLVDDNTSTISLLKIMGYTDKQISKVFLSVYTSCFIIFYLLSIPIAKNIISNLIDYLSSYLDISLSFNISLSKIILGLIIFLIFYYIGISTSKKKIAKVSFDEVLKE